MPDSARIPGLWAWSALNPPLAAVPLPAALPAPKPSVLLYAAQSSHLPALHVLAQHWRESRERWPVHIAEPDPAPERLLDQFSPAVVVVAGSVLPPRLTAISKARGIGLILIDTAQAKAPGLWHRWPGMTRALLQCFSVIHAQDPVSAQDLQRATAGRVSVSATGALARYGAAAPCNEAEREALAAQIGTRPLWFAQDVAASEIATLLAAHKRALRAAHRLLLVVTPSDVSLGTHAAQKSRELGFETALRSIDEELDETTRVYVADGGDPAGLFLRLAPICYLGGTLDLGATQADPFEAAALGSAIICGAARQRAEQGLLQDLVAHGATIRVGSANELGDAVARLLSPEAAAELTLRAWEQVTQGAQATETVAQSMGDWLKLNAPRST